MNKKTIQYPYIPKGYDILYVSMSNPYIQLAKEFARTHSLDKHQQTGSVIVRNDEVLGCGANGSDYHDNHVCQRVMQGTPTGQGYELCEGCHPDNHSEHNAIEDARSNGNDTLGADLYLWGHWWYCKSCWDVVIESGIARVFLAEGSEVLFNKDNPDNVVGKQFE